MIPSKSWPTSSELLTLIAVIIVIAVLYFAREIFIPLALSILLAFLLTPVVALVEKLRLGRIPAVLLVLVLALVLIIAAGWALKGQFTNVLNQLPNYTANIAAKIDSLRGSSGGSLNKAVNAVKGLSKELSSPAAEKPSTSGESRQTSPRSSPAAQAVPVKVEGSTTSSFAVLRGEAGSAASILAEALIVIVFTLFMLANREDLRNRALRLAGKGQLNLMTVTLDDASRRISRYLFLQFLVNSSYGLLFGFGLYLLRIPHAALWGILCGILRFIPYFGTLIGAVFPITLALAVFPGWSHALYVLALYLGIELTISYVMEPWLYGVHTGISPFAILVAAIFWATLWGPMGLILSVPLTVCLTVLGRNIPQLKFIEILLGDEPVLTPEAKFYQRLLAMDLEEARDIAEAYLKEKPLTRLYDCVLIPALGLAERDRHTGALDQERENFIWQGAKELIEEFGESFSEAALAPGAGGKASSGAAEPPQDTRPSGIRIVCAPARDQSDALIALMLAQLLDRAGYDAKALAATGPEEIVGQAAQQQAQIVCVSSLLPFAFGQARSLCRKLRIRCPELKIILGLWNFEGGISKAQARVKTPTADRVATTLSDAMGQIYELAPLHSTGH